MAGIGIATGFFTSMAAGVLGALLLAPFQELRRFFFALNTSLAFAFLSLSTPYRTSPFAILAGRPAAGGAAEGLASLAAGLALLLVIAYLAALYRPAGGEWRSLLMAATTAALVATAADGWVAARGGGGAWLFGVNALAAAALLGSVIVGMILGHWYLVRRPLAASHLVRFSVLFGWAVGVRAALLVLGLVICGLESPDGVSGLFRRVAMERAVFFWPRLLLGIVAPAVFAWMIYQTARIRSTQSATGLLYLAVILVLMGEFLARFLAVKGPWPI
ncbi:MAG TPA: hypothetical protein VFT43_06490 [Candidatus Polarisedimenticolia bacterium]|nr:hypothetical protein [Candidatus Polarisedimenticolia bacterium]